MVFMARFGVILPALWYAGCSQVEYIDRPYEVQVPIPVACVDKMPVPPSYATDMLTESSSDADILRALVVEREQQAGYIDTLEAVLVGCSE
jgi:hypothetical protein